MPNTIVASASDVGNLTSRATTTPERENWSCVTQVTQAKFCYFNHLSISLSRRVLLRPVEREGNGREGTSNPSFRSFSMHLLPNSIHINVVLPHMATGGLHHPPRKTKGSDARHTHLSDNNPHAAKSPRGCHPISNQGERGQSQNTQRVEIIPSKLIYFPLLSTNPTHGHLVGHRFSFRLVRKPAFTATPGPRLNRGRL